MNRFVLVHTDQSEDFLHALKLDPHQTGQLRLGPSAVDGYRLLVWECPNPDLQASDLREHLVGARAYPTLGHVSHHADLLR